MPTNVRTAAGRPPPFEAARATGATFPQLARFVGAGGIGFYMLRYLQLLQYDGVLTLLFIVFVTVVAIDLGSLAIRSRYLTRLPTSRG